MRKNSLQIIVAAMTLATMCAPASAAPEYSEPCATAMESALPVTGVAESTDGVNNTEEETGPTIPDGYIGGHAYVDLGLPSGTLWAVNNVGAASEYDSGDYFAWGETEPKELYGWETYKYYVGYTDDGVELIDIGDSISGTEYDAAAVNWGNGWSMPNWEQLDEIFRNTFVKRTVENGVEGVRVYTSNTSKEGKSIFLGDFREGNIGPYLLDTGGHYWGGVYALNSHKPSIMALHIMTQRDVEGVEWKSPAYRCGGYCIRPVISRKDAGVATSPKEGALTLTVTGRVAVTSRPPHNGQLELTDIAGHRVATLALGSTGTQLPDIPGMYIATVREDGVPVLSKKIIIK